MAAVKAREALLLFSCLFLLAESSPLKDKNLFAPRASRRIKTVVHASQNQSPLATSTSSDTGAYPNPNSSVARFDSSQKTSAGDVNKQTSAGKQTEHSSLTSDSAAQTLRTRGPHSHLPAISNFGDRIHNRPNIQSSGCRVKGGCSVQIFTPDASTTKTKTTSGENNIQWNRQQSVSRVVPDQQQIQVSGVNEIKETVRTQQSDARDKNVHQSPDYEGLISPHDFSARPEIQPPPIQDERFNVQNVDFPEAEIPQFQDGQIQSNIDNVGIFTDQGPIQTDFNNQMQYVTQQDFSDYTDTQQNENIGPVQVAADFDKPAEFVSSSGFSGSDSQAHIEQSNFDGVTQTDQKSFSQDFHSSGFSGSNSQAHIEQSNFDGVTQTDQKSFSQDFPSSGFSGSNSQANIEQSNFDGATQTDQKSFSQVFTTNAEQPIEIQQVAGQPEFPVSDNHNAADDGQYYHYGNPIDWLRYSVPGNPGEDYPILYQVPQTSFDCKQQQFSAGIFGDMEASCQVFHICKDNGEQASFLCPNGTVFNQQYFVCDWWYNFKCSDTPTFYNLNADLYWDWDSFTPQQVLNVPPSGNQVDSNFQGNFQEAFNGVSQGVSTATAHETSSPHNAVKSTIAVDNSAVADKNIGFHQQRVDEHVFTDEKSTQSNAQNNFQRGNQNKQVQQNFPSSFTPALSSTRGLQPTTASPLGNNNFRTKPDSSFFGNQNIVRNDNNVSPVSSDTGANRQTGGEAGTRYPDLGAYGQHFSKVDTPISQNPTSFVSQNQLVDNTFRNDQNLQNNNVKENQASQFDFDQQTTADFGENGGNRHTQTQEVQQEYLSDSFGQNTPSTFQTSRNEQTYDMDENHLNTQNKISGQFAPNQGHEHTSLNQLTQEDQRATTPFVPESNAFTGADQGSSQENEKPQFQSQRPIHDETNTLKDNSRQNNANAVLSVQKQDTDIHDNLKQEHISSSFNSGSDSSFNGQHSENYGPQNENTFVIQDVGSPAFDGNTNQNFGNVGSGINLNTERNPNVHQDQIKISFDDENQRASGMAIREDNYNTNSVNSNQQQGSFNENSVNFNQNQNTGQDTALQNNDAFRGVQQDSVTHDFPKGSGFEEKRNSVAHNNMNQGQAPNSYQPNSQNTPLINNNQNQIVRENQHGIQQHVSVPFDEPDQSSFDRNRNHNAPEFSSNTNQANNFIGNNQDFSNTNSYQMTEQNHASNQQDGTHSNANREGTSKFQSEFSNTRPFDQAHQNVQQENVIFPFDGSKQDSFTQINKGNQNEFSVVPDHQTSVHTSNVPEQQITNQINIPTNDQQNRQSTGFEDRGIPAPFPAGNTDEENRLNQNLQSFNNQNHASFSGQNVPINDQQVQQEYVQTAFEGMQPDVFGSSVNGGNAVLQNGYGNVEQGNQFSTNQQNEFKPTFSGHQQDNQFRQNFRQEHVQISLDNNQQVFTQSSFDQNGNHGNFQHINNNNYQSNSFINRDEINQNSNAGFQVSQNNFHPGNIYMMNRGGLQNQNQQQQRLSFRPYGQNDQNLVNFPGNSQGTFISNQQNIDLPAHSNAQGPSNHNFFVTNGHQVQSNQPQPSSHQPPSHQQSLNNFQDVRQHDLQQINQGNSNNAAAYDDSRMRVLQNQGINQRDFSSGNTNTNSQVKGHSTGNVNGRSFLTPNTAETNSQQHTVVPIKPDDIASFNQQVPESPSSMNYNGWRPVNRKY